MFDWLKRGSHSVANAFSSGRPWAMLEEAFEQLVSSVQSSSEKLASAPAYQTKRPKQKLRVEDGVAMIDVKGPIFAEDELYAWYFDGVTNASLQAQIEMAANDPGVSAIFLDIDSPGGEVGGTAETAKLIFDARKKKPVIGFSPDLIASAAYWIGSAATKLFIAPTTTAGSIGVRTTYYDTTKMLEGMGVKKYDFVSSQSPKKIFDPSKKEHRDDLVGQLDQVAQIFIDAVALHRNTKSETVASDFGQGGTIVGAEAVEKGMADKVTTFAQALDFARKANRSNMSQTTLTAGEEKPATTAVAEVPAATAGAEPAPTTAAAEPALNADAVSKAITAERERIKGIDELCANANAEDRKVIEALKWDGKSTAGDAALKLVESQKARLAKIKGDRRADAADLPEVAETGAERTTSVDKKAVDEMANIIAGVKTNG